MVLRVIFLLFSFQKKKIKALGPLITDEHAFIAILTFKGSHFLILQLSVDK